MSQKFLCLTLALCFSASLLARATTREEILPAGTIIHCTLDEPNFSSKTAQLGDPVVCQVGAVSAFGHSVFPRGTLLSGHLQDAKNPGRFVGKGWLDLEFDRIVLPGAEVLPLQVKIIAAPHLKTDREGKMHGGGHPMRDVVGWMLPVLWPIKILTLPMRGPYPALKGEARLTMRLMEDVEVPVVMAQAPMRDTPSEISPSSIPSTYMLVRPSPTILVTRGSVRVLEQESSEEAPPDLSQATESLSHATLPMQAREEQRQPTIILLHDGSGFVAAYYWVHGGQMHCVSQDGQVRVFSLENLDLQQTVVLNHQRNVEFVLHRRNWLAEQ